MGVPSPSPESRFHVLAVDDSLIDRKLIERLLKTSSYQVTAVDSGSKALEFLGLMEEKEDQGRRQLSVSVNHRNNDHEVEVNLIITDYCMPGMTGYELLRKIKESTALKDIPVVIMSSENVPSRINRCLEEGAEEFFLKPVQMSDVSKLKPHLLKGRSTTKEVELDVTATTATPAAVVATNKRKGDSCSEERIISSPGETRAKYSTTNPEFAQS